MGRVIGVILAIGICTLVFAACATDTGKAVDTVKAAGVLKVGVNEDVPGLGRRNAETNAYEGLEIEIARLIANEIFSDAEKVEFVPVTANKRGVYLDSGEVDMIIATFTITDERKLSFNFTDPYYTDAVGMLVRADSGITSIADCDGKIIGVAQTATSRAVMETAASEAKVGVEFKEYKTYPEIKAALVWGQIDVFSVDRSVLRGYVDEETVLTDDMFDPQPYGIATRLSNTGLAKYVDDLIKKWNTDGTIQGLVNSFGL